MRDKQAPKVPLKRTGTSLELGLRCPRGSVRNDGRVRIEAAHLIAKHSRNVRIVLGERDKVEANGRTELTKREGERAEQKNLPWEVYIVEEGSKEDLGPKANRLPRQRDSVGAIALTNQHDHAQRGTATRSFNI
jgi:hypothetical protein